jgi:cytochrome c biogenesis protein CcmG/thiol:disulfide interchange protein DsbE
VLYQLSYRRTNRKYIAARPLTLLLVKRLVLPIVVSLLGAGLLGLLIYGVSHQAASRTLDDAVFHGEHPRAPDATISLAALTGGGHSDLSAYAGKVVLLNFWASWCEPCEMEAPRLEAAQRQLQAHDATVLGVTYRDASSDSQAFAHHYHLSYPSFRDVNGDFAGAYGTDRLPESFVIDRSGHIVAISRGEVTSAFLTRAIKLAASS